VDAGTEPSVRSVRVTLREITAANRDEVERLRVAPEQDGFVDGVSRSLAEAAATPGPHPWCRAVHDGNLPLGFVMLADDVPPDDPTIRWRYYLWRMLIDERYQGRGYGRAALDRLVEYLGTRPGADVLVSSIVLVEGSPLSFYLRYGFEVTDEWFDHEQLLRLPLAPA
jgi:diamine N-acetyltransferase